MGKKTNEIKYFELPIQEARNWKAIDYFLFVLEALYSTVFPFLSGMLLVARKELIWIFMLILPIYFKINIEKKFRGKQNKRVYVK